MSPRTQRIRDLRDGPPATICTGRAVAGLIVAMLLSACTTLQSSQLPPEALQSGIRSGALVEPGDRVNVVTADGKERAFTVTAVDTEVIRGESSGTDVAVAIDDVIALRKREIEPVRTTFAASYAALAASFFVFVIEVFDTW